MTIKAVEPNSGPAAGGATITIHGSGFTLAQQYQAKIDNTFNFEGNIYNYWPSVMLLQPDGKLVVAGKFSRDDQTGDQVARFNPDGSIDRTFKVKVMSIIKF